MGPGVSSIPFSLDQKELILSNLNLSEIPYKIPANHSLEVLNLSNNAIRKLPKGLGNLISLIISHNQLQELPKKLCDRISSLQCLESLDLSHNQIKKLPNFINDMPNLRRLNLFNNKLTEISVSSTSLQFLDIGKNLLTQIPALPSSLLTLNADCNFISEFKLEHPALQKLNLKMNKISTIDTKTRCRTLFTLDISFNQLESLADISDNFPRLKLFDASYNHINTVLKLPRTLSELNLSHNGTTSLPETLASYSCLLHLDVSYNKLLTMPLLPLGIQTLDLQHNTVEQLVITRVPDLAKINCSFNRMKTQPDYATTSTTVVNLQCNQLSTISISSLKDSVTRIDFSGNLIQHIPDSLFHLQNLLFLSLAHNRITTIPDSLSRSNLISLNLSGNNLEAFPSSLPDTIEQLYVSGCGLRMISECVSQKADLVELAVDDNELSTLPTFIGLRNLFCSRNRFECIPVLPSTLVYADFSFNKLKSLPALDSFTDLQSFNTSHNPCSDDTTEDNMTAVAAFQTHKAEKVLSADVYRMSSHGNCICGCLIQGENTNLLSCVERTLESTAFVETTTALLAESYAQDSYDSVSYGLFQLEDGDLSLSICGDIQVLTVDASLTMQKLNIEDSQTTHFDNIGNKLVFHNVRPPKCLKYHLQSTDQAVIITTFTTYNKLMVALTANDFPLCDTASETACALRNMATSTDASTNSSFIVLKPK